MRKNASVAPAPHDLRCHVLREGVGDVDDDGAAGEVVLLSFTPTAHARLTGAERDVALAIARGLSNAEIGAQRGVSPRTVANQVAALLRKCGVSSRVELAGVLGPLDFL